LPGPEVRRETAVAIARLPRWRRSRIFVGAILALAACSAPGAPLVLRDDRGVPLALERPAERIVALAPHLAELAYGAGAGGRLVGATRFSDYPPAARALPRVGDASRADLERVLSLAPDVVLAWKSGNQAADIERLESLGRAVFVTEPRRLSDIARIVRAIGLVAGTAQAAERAARAFEREIEALRVRFALRPTVRVFYEVWPRPLTTVGGAHFISDVLRLCGGENVFAGERLLAPTVSLEAVAAARPQVVIGGAGAHDADELARRWRESALPALRALPVVHVDPDHLQRPTLRIAEGARAVCEHLESVRDRRRAEPP
jgi:iron complex transport system substrate-binding protein